jgi:hypothetical protein
MHEEVHVRVWSGSRKAVTCNSVEQTRRGVWWDFPWAVMNIMFLYWLMLVTYVIDSDAVVKHRPCWEASNYLAGKELLIPVPFMEPRGSLQEAISGPCPRSDESSLHPHANSCKIHFNIILLSTPMSRKSLPFFQWLFQPIQDPGLLGVPLPSYFKTEI